MRRRQSTLVEAATVAYHPATGHGGGVMARYLLKRVWSSATEDALLESALRSKRVRDESFLDIRWDHSHVVVDEDGRASSYCVYEAPSAERVLEHATATGGHFIDQVLSLMEDVEGTGAPPWTVRDPSPRFMVVQRWADGVTRDQIDADLRAADAGSPDVTWEHSHLGMDDRGRVHSHGVYRANGDAVVRRYAGRLADSEIVELFEIGGDVRPEDLAD